MDESGGRHDNGRVSKDDEREYWSSVPQIRGSLAHSENDNAGGRRYGEADVRAYIADKRAEEPDDKTGGTGDAAVDLGAVADAMAGADQGTIDGWRAETDRCRAAELAAADADLLPAINTCAVVLNPTIPERF
jgi:hypothetical protein